MGNFNIRVKSGRAVIRTHENVTPENLGTLIAQEVQYTMSGGDGQNPVAAKLEIDPRDGGQRWEIYPLKGKVVNAYVEPKAPTPAPAAATDGATTGEQAAALPPLPEPAAATA